MNAVDKVKLIALEWCMTSGMRYNDAMWYVLNTDRFIRQIHEEVIKSVNDVILIEAYDIEFHAEYLVYVGKMKAAGMM